MTAHAKADAPLTDEALVDQLASRRETRLAKEWGSYAPRQPIASDLLPCLRYQVHRITSWQVRPPPDAFGMARIENGRVQEPAMIRQLEDEGWEIVEQQGPFEVRGRSGRVVARGKIDGKIRVGPRELIPFDTKDTGEFVLDGIEDEETARENSLWTFKWWAQLQLYALGTNQERALLYLGARGVRKPIVIRLDYARAESLLLLCELAMELIEAFAPLGIDHETADAALSYVGVPYHPRQSLCGSCPFRDRACFPPRPEPDAVASRPDLAALVADYLEAKPYAAKADRLRKRIKAETEGHPVTIAGDFILEGEVRVRNMKAKPATPAHRQEYWAFQVLAAGTREKVG